MLLSNGSDCKIAMCKSLSNKLGLKILNFNVEGLTSELDDPSFLGLLYEHDICLVNETWKKDESKIGLPGLWDFSLIRPKTTKKGRPSGGITICDWFSHGNFGAAAAGGGGWAGAASADPIRKRWLLK